MNGVARSPASTAHLGDGHPINMLHHSTRSTIARWLGRAGFALSDQALLSATTFVLNLMFARWMSAEEFGVFAVQMSCILVLSGVQNALVLEPMTIFGAGKYRSAIHGYIARLGLLQLFALAAVCIAALVWIEIGKWAVSWQAALSFEITLCTMMLFAFVRRTIYIEILPRFALVVSSTYAATCIGLALVLYRLGDFSPANGLQVFAAGSSMGGLIGWWLFRSRQRAEASAEAPPTMRALFSDHWRYGRWALGSAIVNTGSSTAYPPIIASILSFGSAGMYRAIDTLFAPVGQFVTALSTLALPAIVGRRSQNESAVTRRWVRTALLGAGFIAALYVVPMVLFGRTIALHVFAKPEYASDWLFIAFIGFAAVLGTLQSAAFLFLRSLEKPHGEFWSQLTVAAATFTIGIGAGLLAGLDGLAATLMVSRGCGLIIALWLLDKEIAKRERNTIGSNWSHRPG
jgi:O-antigen/teichoic acid export membrane protein